MWGIYRIRGGIVCWLGQRGVKIRRVGTALFSERRRGLVVAGWHLLFARGLAP